MEASQPGKRAGSVSGLDFVLRLYGKNQPGIRAGVCHKQRNHGPETIADSSCFACYNRCYVPFTTFRDNFRWILTWKINEARRNNSIFITQLRCITKAKLFPPKAFKKASYAMMAKSKQALCLHRNPGLYIPYLLYIFHFPSKGISLGGFIGCWWRFRRILSPRSLWSAKFACVQGNIPAR